MLTAIIGGNTPQTHYSGASTPNQLGVMYDIYERG
jgi:hypothetical protein